MHMPHRNLRALSQRKGEQMSEDASLCLTQPITIRLIELTQHGCFLRGSEGGEHDKSRTVNLAIYFLTQVKMSPIRISLFYLRTFIIHVTFYI